MAKDHSHPEPVKCAHDLGWCAKCERPYCKACGKEWHEQAAESSFLKALIRDSDAKASPKWPEPYRSPQWADPRPPGYYSHPQGPAVILCEHQA